MRHRDRGRDRDRPSSAAAASTPTRTARYSKSGEAARSVGFNSEAAGADRVSGGCVRLPACQLPTGSSWWTSLSANSSIMLRSYSSIVSILSPRMPAMRSRRRVRVSGARRVRAVIFCEGLRGLREHNGEVVGDAAWPAIIDLATHDRLVGLLHGPSRRRENLGRPRVHPLVGLVYCASCGGRMTTAIAPRQGRGRAAARTRTRLPSTCAHCGRAAGDVCGGLRDRPVEEPGGHQDRAVRRRKDDADQRSPTRYATCGSRRTRRSA